MTETKLETGENDVVSAGVAVEEINVSTDALADAKEPESTEVPARYVLPSWFLNHNVWTREELGSLQVRSWEISPVTTTADKTDAVEINTVETDTTEASTTEASTAKTDTVETEESKDPEDVIKDDKSDRVDSCIATDDEGSVSDGQEETVECELPQDKFSELRDVTAAALVRDPTGAFFIPNGTILLHCPAKDAIPSINRLLQHLAKDLQGSLVSIDFDDMRDLSVEFESQDLETHGELDDDRKKSNRSDFAAKAFDYFGARCKRKASNESWARCMSVAEAVLNGPSAKAKQLKSTQENSQNDVDVDSHGESVEAAPPLLFFIRNYNEMTSEKYCRRFVRRFWDFVHEKRKAGQKVVLLISIVQCCENQSNCSSNYSSHGSYPSEYQLSKKAVVNEASTVDIDPSHLAGMKNLDEYSVVAENNIRRLKRLLRYCIPELLTPEVSEAIGVHEPFSTWEARGFKAHYDMVAASIWSDDGFNKATIQMAGRGFSESKLSWDDVYNALLRTGLCKIPVEPEADKKTEESSTEEKAETWEERLKRIRRDTNSYEDALLNSVVNPDDIETTFDDVIIDEETKETIKHMVSLSTFKPEAASESLLKHIHISGAMFYGPPGTGKTHLSRAIAKASGSSMLSIDAATIESKWVGETEKSIKAAFSVARKLHPCVLFIDEVDSLFYRRGCGDKSWERSRLAQFLSEMDGLSKSDKAPFVVVATNRPQDLDDAFYRRLPHKIFFKLPDLTSRAKILKIYLKKEDLDPQVDIETLATATKGYSGSDLRSFCAMAAMTWAIEQTNKVSAEERSNKMNLTVAHFAKALKKIRPSVSPKNLQDFAEFAKRYNPETIENALADDAGRSAPWGKMENMLLRAKNP